jgi:homoserine kinase
MKTLKTSVASQSSQPGQSSPVKALSKEEVEAKLAAIAAANAAARETLSKQLGDERWGKLRAQAVTQGVTDENLTVLCGKMLRTRTEWHPDNTAAALHGACNGLLIELGSELSPADVAAYEGALAAPVGQ